MKFSGDDFGGILRTSLAETLGRISSMDEEWQGSGKYRCIVKISADITTIYCCSVVISADI